MLQSARIPCLSVQKAMGLLLGFGANEFSKSSSMTLSAKSMQGTDFAGERALLQ